MTKINFYPKEKLSITEKKHGNSNWMTKGILNSINTNNALYKTLFQTSLTNEDVHSRLKSEYTEYRAKLRKSIREAKRLYYLRLLAIHKNDIQKTWIVINNTLNNNSRNSRQSEFIVNNNKLTDPGDIANAFNNNISLTSDASFQIKFNLLIIIVIIYINKLNHTLNSNPSVKLISVI